MPDKSILVLDESNQVIQLANTDFSAVAETVLEKVVSDASVGTLSTTDLGGGQSTLIGTFSDIYRLGDPGSESTGTNTVNRTLYQNLHSGSVGSVSALPVEWNTAQGEVKQADTSYLNDLADDIIQYMVDNDGPGTYKLATSAPTGGTWSEAFSIVDALSTSNNDSPVSKIYVKTSGTLSTSKKLLKTDGSNLKGMSDSEVEQLAEAVKQRIIDTGIGQYRFQETAPTFGTWVSMGTIDDNYYGTVGGNFVGSGPVSYTRTLNYSGGFLSYYSWTNFSPRNFWRWVFYTDGIFNGFYGPNNDVYLNFTGQGAFYHSGSSFYAGPNYTRTGFYVGPGSVNYYGLRVNTDQLTDDTLTLWRRVS